MGLLRLILALSVIVAHSTPILGCSFVSGSMAVEAFFIISGFYMSLILNEKYINKNNSYRLFISNRLLKLYPIYWTIIAFILVSSLLTLIFSHGNSWASLGAYHDYHNQYGNMSIFSYTYLVLTNIILIGQDWLMFLGLNTSTGNLSFANNIKITNTQMSIFLLIPQAWSLSVEICFYMIAPFIVRRKILIIILIMAVSLSIRYLLVEKGLNYDPWSYRLFPNEIVFFLAGVLAYKLYHSIKSIEISKWIPYFMLIIILIETFFYHSNSLPVYLKNILYFISFTLFIPFIFKKTKNFKWDTMVGDLSYPMYISHILIIFFVNKKYFILESKGTTVAIISIVVSIILNKFITKPIEKYRQNRVKKT